MEQKFRKKRLNSDLGLNLRSLEQKFRKKTRKFRPRSLQPKKDQVKNAWIQILERKHSGKKRLNILLWKRKSAILAWPGQARTASYFGPNVPISGQMSLFQTKCPYFGPNVLISGQMSLFRAKCPYFIEKYLKFIPRYEFKGWSSSLAPPSALKNWKCPGF